MLLIGCKQYANVVHINVALSWCALFIFDSGLLSNQRREILVFSTSVSQITWTDYEYLRRKKPQFLSVMSGKVLWDGIDGGDDDNDCYFDDDDDDDDDDCRAIAAAAEHILKQSLSN